MYPFGYGLTYTTFEYSDFSTDKETYNANDDIELTFKLKNTGSMEADEVVQAYVHRINPAVEWPAKELKAFDRITLKPGESREVSLKIPVKNLMYWNETKQVWDYDLCDLELLVGASATDIKLDKKIALK
jgi:beta-glucosidase